MYMYINMARTIMISNEVYGELKEIKKDKSFSEVIIDLMKSKRKKTVAGLKDCMGLLDKDDDEYGRIMKELRPMYKRWTKKYA